MKKPKFAFILEALTPSERKYFENGIKAKKRKQLFQLYKILEKGLKTGDLSNERLYELLYQKPYEKSKSYLLRNELRLLSNELKLFLAQQNALEKIKKDNHLQSVLYLEALFEKTDIEFYLGECLKGYEAAKNNNDFTNAAKILMLYIKAFIQQTSPTVESYLKLEKILTEQEYLVTQSFLESLVDTKKFQAFASKSISAMQPKSHAADFSNQVSLNLADKKWQSDYLRYQLLWTKSYLVEGEERIQLLKTAESLIDRIHKSNFSNQSEIAKVNASIALDYFLKSDYENSILHHQKMLAQKKYIKDKDLAVYLFNYISTLLRVEEFRNALQLISENEKLLLQQERLYDRFLNIKAMCLLLLDKVDASESCIPPDRKEGGMYNYFYFRIVQSMIFCEREAYDLALNELQNLQFSLHYNQLKNSGFKELSHYLQTFYKLQRDQKYISNYEVEKERLIHEIENLDDNLVKFQYLLPYKWLVKAARR